jgi:hypothetical protein
MRSIYYIVHILPLATRERTYRYALRGAIWGDGSHYSYTARKFTASSSKLALFTIKIVHTRLPPRSAFTRASSSIRRHSTLVLASLALSRRDGVAGNAIARNKNRPHRTITKRRTKLSVIVANDSCASQACSGNRPLSRYRCRLLMTRKV